MSELTDAQKLIGAYLDGCGVKDSESHARLLLESLMDLGFVVVQRLPVSSAVLDGRLNCAGHVWDGQ